MEIIRLAPPDWEKFKRLRLEALEKDSEAFGSSYEESLKKPDAEWKEKLEKNQVLVAHEGDELIGLAAFYQEEGEKIKHIAYIWGVYVRESFRGQGVGRKLMEEVLGAIRSNPEIEKANLNVNTQQAGAVKLYESLGFTITGTSHRELKVDGKYYDEHSMEIIF